ncbi:MAG: hypothetical protein IJU69_01735 [Bacteroidales bacterium]|nr:hypothetical protein [Bacteroidales bacterium]
MNREDIFEGLKEVISKVRPKLDLSIVNENSSLVKDLGIDSLAMLIVALSIEDKFSIRFERPEPFQTVKEVIDYIETKV